MQSVKQAGPYKAQHGVRITYEGTEPSYRTILENPHPPGPLRSQTVVQSLAEAERGRQAAPMHAMMKSAAMMRADDESAAMSR